MVRNIGDLSRFEHELTVSARAAPMPVCLSALGATVFELTESARLSSPSRCRAVCLFGLPSTPWPPVQISNSYRSRLRRCRVSCPARCWEISDWIHSELHLRIFYLLFKRPRSIHPSILKSSRGENWTHPNGEDDGSVAVAFAAHAVVPTVLRVLTDAIAVA